MLKWEVNSMRQRIGMILCVTGILLLFSPRIDLQQLLSVILLLGKDYWPFALVIAGLVLLRPHKRKRKS